MTTWIRWTEWLFQLPFSPSKAMTLNGAMSTITAVVDSQMAKSSPLNDSLRIGVAVRWCEISVGSQADFQGNENGQSSPQ
jgi:hypothetical protein